MLINSVAVWSTIVCVYKLAATKPPATVVFMEVALYVIAVVFCLSPRTSVPTVAANWFKFNPLLIRSTSPRKQTHLEKHLNFVSHWRSLLYWRYYSPQKQQERSSSSALSENSWLLWSPHTVKLRQTIRRPVVLARPKFPAH